MTEVTALAVSDDRLSNLPKVPTCITCTGRTQTVTCQSAQLASNVSITLSIPLLFMLACLLSSRDIKLLDSHEWYNQAPSIRSACRPQKSQSTKPSSSIATIRIAGAPSLEQRSAQSAGQHVASDLQEGTRSLLTTCDFAGMHSVPSAQRNPV